MKLPTTMKDNVTTRDFLSRLPIEVTMNDYAGAEKIFYPEPAFNTEGAPKGHTPLPWRYLICMLLGETSLSFIKVEVIAVN